MCSRSTVDFAGLSAVEVYDLRCINTIARFPQDFWNKISANEILRHVILEKLKLTRKEICIFDFRKELKQLKIIGALEVFDYSTYKLIRYCFPELNIMAWELKCTPNCFFDDYENVKKALKWLFEKENLETRKQITENFSADLLRYNGLKTLCEKYTLIQLIHIVVPEMKIKEWELNKVFVWNKDLIKQAVKWLIEEKLCWEYKDVCKNISASVFRRNGLEGMLSKGCGNSTIAALDIAYPGMYSKNVLKAYTGKV